MKGLILGAVPNTADASENKVIIRLDDYDLDREINTPLLPHHVDILIFGATKGVRKAFTRINGGRRVVLLGGAYSDTIFLDRFSVSGCVEGAYIRFPEGIERDALSIRPSRGSRSVAHPFGGTRAIIKNCRCENVQGRRDGVHGDAFQLPGSLNNPPEYLHIENFTATCGYQGLFLAPQATNRSLVTDTQEGTYSVEDAPIPLECRIINCNLLKTRRFIIDRQGEDIALFVPIDSSAAARGNRAYPKYLTEFWVAPFEGEPLLQCISKGSLSGANGIDSRPVLDRSGRFAEYRPEMLVRDGLGAQHGRVRYGRPPKGDFVQYSASMIGGPGRPGIGYQPPS